MYQIDRQLTEVNTTADLPEELRGKLFVLDVTDKVLSSGQLVDGQYTKDFESWLCKYTQCKYAVTVHSGTQALEIYGNFLASCYRKAKAF